MVEATRRAALAGAGVVALTGTLPAASPVDVVRLLHPEAGYDGQSFLAALADHLGWTQDKGRQVMKAAMHDFCSQPYDQQDIPQWLDLLRREVGRALATPGYESLPDVIERASIGKLASPPNSPRQGQPPSG